MQKYLCYLLFITLVSCKTKISINYKVNDAEATSFAKTIEKSIKDGEREILNNAIHAPAMAQKLNKIKASQKDINSMIKGMDIGKKITGEIAGDGTYEFVKIISIKEKKYVLFRLQGTNGINYHQIELCKVADKVKISDIYIFLTGEFLTETIQNLFNTIAGDGNYSKKDERDLEEFSVKIKELKSHIEDEEYDKAKKLYDALPAKLKSNSTVLLYGVFIAQGKDSVAYEAAMNAYKKSKPNAFNLDLLMIDGLFLKKDYKGALAAINRLDAYINKDPFLDYYRYLIYNMLEDDKNALFHIEKVTKEFPKYPSLQLELIASYKQLGKQKELEQAIANYKSNTDFNQQKLSAILDY
jgi:tetratricopeptide (TPR) repeat protein